MDDSRIDPDAFSNALGVDVSRRGLVRGLAGGGLAVTGIAGALQWPPHAAAQDATPTGELTAAHRFQVGQLDLWVFDDGDYTVPERSWPSTHPQGS